MSSKINFLIVALGRVVQVATLLATFKVLTAVLPQEELGGYFFFLSVSGAIGLIIVNPAGTYFNRFLQAWIEQRLLIRKTLLFIAFAVAAAILTVVAGNLLGWNKEFVNLSTLTAVCIYVLGVTVSNTFIPALNIGGRPALFAGLTSLCQLTALFAAYLACMYSPTAANWLAASGAVNIIFGLIGAIALVSLQGTFKDSSDNIADQGIVFWRFAYPIAIANVAVWFLTQGYRPMVESFAGLSALAIVGLGLGLASAIVAAFEALVHQLFLPNFYRHTHSEDRHLREHNWNRLWRTAMPAYMGLVIVLMGLSHHFADVLTGGNYPQAGLYLAIGAGAELLRMIGNLVVLYAQSERNMKPTRLPYYIGAAVALVGSLYAIQVGELQYVAYSLIFGQGAATLALVKMVITSNAMLKLSVFSMIRFLVVPSILVYLAKDVPAPVALSGVALGMGILTIHYWWQVRET